MSLQIPKVGPKFRYVDADDATDHGDTSKRGSLAWAIDNVGANGYIQLTPGTYDIETEIDFPQNDMTISGSGVDSSILNLTNNTPCFNINAKNAIVLRDFSITDATGGGSNYQIYSDGAAHYNCVIDRIKSTGSAGFIYLTTTSGSGSGHKIRNCNVNVDVQALNISNNAYIDITNNYFVSDHMTFNGNFFFSNLDKSLILGNKFRTSVTEETLIAAIGMYFVGNCYNNIISNNNFYFENNLEALLDTIMYIIFMHDGIRNIITNNIIRAETEEGELPYSIYGVYLRESYHNVISENFIGEGCDVNVYLKDSGFNRVSFNTDDGTTSYFQVTVEGDENSSANQVLFNTTENSYGQNVTVDGTNTNTIDIGINYNTLKSSIPIAPPYYLQADAPGTSDVPEGGFVMWEDSDNNETYLVFNNPSGGSGTIKKVQLT